MGFLIGAFVVLVAGVTVFFLRRFHTDEVFDRVTPGLTPAEGQPVRRRKVRRGEAPPIAVQFTPPQGVTPGLVGTLIDNEASPVDISATLIDLAVRGWLVLRRLDHPQTPAGAERKGKKTKVDWQLIKGKNAAAGVLSSAERALVNGLFAKSGRVTLSELRSSHGELLRKAILDLYAETLARGWFQTHPRKRPLRWGLTGGILIALGVLATLGVGWLLDLGFIGVGMIVAGVLLWAGTRRLTTGLTAEGYAVRVQSLGFKKYLATAEAEQLKFESSVDVYSRYLPYAMVFGVVDHWNQVLVESIRNRAIARGTAPDDLGAVLGELVDDLSWIDLNSIELGELFGALTPDSLATQGGGDFGEALTSFGNLLGDGSGTGDGLGGSLSGLGDSLSALTDGLGTLTSGLGDFAASVTDLLGGLGDGCDLGGCDL